MRKLALAVAMAMASSRIYALGLGEIELHSALNEPLDADVRLLAAQPGELDNAVVRLAPNNEFERAGIERPAILSDVNFTIVRGNDGAATLHITSTQPIREPFLDFIVQLSWQSGRLLREYTLLLDPPVFGEEKKAPVTAPAAQATAEPAAPVAPSVPAPMATVPSQDAAPRQAPQNVTAAASAAHKPRLNVKKGETTYGPTQRSDTLWSIASNLRPDDSVTVYQMMMALLKENPEAFYGDNVNTLKAGYVLRVPDKSVVEAVDATQAEREAARQYEQWRQGHGGAVTPSEDKGTGPANAPAKGAQQSAAAGQNEESGRLRLVAPGDTSAKSAGAGGDAQKELDKLRSELAIAMESSDTAKRESDELRSRVATLENQINSMQRLLTLKDESLNELQKRSGMTAAQPKGESTTPEVEVPPLASAKPAPAKPAPAQSAAPKAKEPTDIFADPTLMAAVAGAALLLLSVLWLIVRRRRNEDDIEPVEGVEDETMEPLVEARQPVQEEQGEQAEATVTQELDNSEQMTQVAEEVAHDAEQDISQAASDLDMLHTPEGDIDPIVEADVYLAYRRYQQAESLIQNALAKQPDRQDLQAKLLEIYYASKNADSFQSVAESLFANTGNNPDNEVWQRILPMGRELCPEHALFSSAADGDEAVDKGAMFDEVSDSVGDVVSGDMEAGLEADTAAAEESFDLNLGGESAEVDLSEPAEQPAEERRAEKMEFDLNLGQEPAGESATVAAEEPAAAAPESLSAALDFANESPAAEEGQMRNSGTEATKEGAEERQAQGNSWEIEPAMSDFGNIDFGLDDADLLAGTDVVGTKLDLARAYIDMGDKDSARDILTEVIEEGTDQQKQEAQGLVEKIA